LFISLVISYCENLKSKKMAEKSSSSGPPMKGGTKDFNWQGVKNMSYRDRESYLGYTVKIGYLEKGAKWNKSDWWI
jgi:hypothetical protein